MAKKDKRTAREAERARLEGVRRKNIIILTIALFLLLGSVVDSQALYSFGVLKIDHTLLLLVTAVVTIGLGSLVWRCWRLYRQATDDLKRLR